MFNNSIKIMFFFILISGLLIIMSSNSWLGAWMGLEINMLSFIPLMSNENNMLTTEASLKYFLIQALASSILLFLIISSSFNENMFTMYLSLMKTFLVTPLLLKSGVAPMHWWFPSVMEGLSWMNCLILLTIQKMAPLMLISYTITFNNYIFYMIIITSVAVGAVGGLNQTSLRKIITYSSINHLGWLLIAMKVSENMWISYFLIYSLLTSTVISIIYPSQISMINQTFQLTKNKIIKLMMFSSLLSLGGLPPFTGFLPKWIIIQVMMANKILILSSIMVVMSLITLYYYLRISYSSFIMMNSEIKWNYQTNNEISKTSLMLTILSVMGLMSLTMMFNLF
uniref:NADH dehydrogenase subunit 2 n=1 Tax=Pseudoglomeris montshadskii TaxID=3036343 RepID=UPI00279D4BB6|nr:NADH dehydrogenase subunit 2 [Pseudoglomeris montshadskii]WGO57522.1 NADH dehydrogenase subunit 2 [Pseudoglomeris montshadskii]